MRARAWNCGLAMAWSVCLAAGCASRDANHGQPKPGSGIAEYQKIAIEARQAVAESLAAIDKLREPTPTAPHPALQKFDEAAHRLEVTSVRSRGRAEAILQRGQTYFEEWKEQLRGATNGADEERYRRLHEHFERVRGRSQQIRDEFRPYMAGLREFRGTLDADPRALNGEPARRRVTELTAGGTRVVQALDLLLKDLETAAAEVKGTTK